MPKNTPPTVLILASGKGLRYKSAGGKTHKLEALISGESVLQRTITAARQAGLPLHLEQSSHEGMGDTLAAAVRATSQSAGWLVLPADMPMVLPKTLRDIAQAIMEGNTAAQPVVGGQPGHPVGFAASQRENLLALQGDEGARTVLAALREAGQVKQIPSEDRGAVEDIDTPADLQRAEALWKSRLSA